MLILTFFAAAAIPFAAKAAAGLGAATIAADLYGGRQDRKAVASANLQNAQLQREFAQNQIQWRVADAKKAGLHPLFAMGASTQPASPSFRVEPQNNVLKSAIRGAQAYRSFRGSQLEKESFQLDNEIKREQLFQLRLDTMSKQKQLEGQGDAVTQTADTEEAVRQAMVKEGGVVDRGAIPPSREGWKRTIPSERPSTAPGRKDREAAEKPLWMPIDYAVGYNMLTVRGDELHEVWTRAGLRGVYETINYNIRNNPDKNWGYGLSQLGWPYWLVRRIVNATHARDSISADSMQNYLQRVPDSAKRMMQQAHRGREARRARERTLDHSDRGRWRTDNY